jgi:hypothetical protein
MYYPLSNHLDTVRYIAVNDKTLIFDSEKP